MHYVHQIYGLYGDSQPMTLGIKASLAAWKDCAVQMDAAYHLWNADEVETLMHTRYHQFWDMYVQVPHPIMREDIGRIAILHSYGGIYADLDTIPNRLSFKQEKLAVCTDSTKRVQVLQGAAGEPFFLRWLQHISEQFACTPYQEKKLQRYVYDTTGSGAMERCLLQPANKAVFSCLRRLHCNLQKPIRELTDADEQSLGVLTSESKSYCTKDYAIVVPVGTQGAALPALPRRLRTIGKSAGPRVAPPLCRSGGKSGGVAERVPRPVPGHWCNGVDVRRRHDLSLSESV